MKRRDNSAYLGDNLSGLGKLDNNMFGVETKS